MTYDISKTTWSKCTICNKSIDEIKKQFGGENKYFSQAFKHHIEDTHGQNLSDYFEKNGIDRPTCECGICNQKVEVARIGASFKWSHYKCGRYKGTQIWSEKAKILRCGKNNPMYGKNAWNKGLGIDDPRIARIAEGLRGKKLTEEHKAKLSQAAKVRIVHGHSGKPHSEKTKEFLRQNTLNLIARGVFKQVRTKPSIAFENILIELNIQYQTEKVQSYFSFDFYLPQYNYFIEVDGDYFHSNPKFYPNGPESKTQKINYSRDISKNKYCFKNNIKLIRFWENDILKNKEQVVCTLKKLLPLEN